LNSARLSSWPGLRTATVVLAAVVIVSAALYSAWEIELGRRNAYARGVQSARVTAESLAEHSVLAMYDATSPMHGAARAIAAAGGLERLDARRAHEILDLMTTPGTALLRLSVIDRDGRLVATSAGIQGRGTYLGDRETVARHLAGATGDQVLIGKPSRSPLELGWVLPVTQALRGADGRVEGVVTGLLDFDYFTRHYAKLFAGRRASAALMRSDGALLARYPFDSRQIGADMSAAFAELQALQRQRRPTVQTSPVDGVQRLYAWQEARNFPLAVVVGLETEDLLTAWHARSAQRIALTAAFSLVVMLLAAVAVRHMHALDAMNAELRERITSADREMELRRQSEEALRVSQRRFEALFHESPAPLALVDAQARRFRDVNLAWCQLFGYARDQAIGRVAADFAIVHNAAERDSLYDALRRDGRVERLEFSATAAGGVERITLVSGRIVDLAGERNVLWSFIDITELRTAQRRIEELANSLEAKVASRTAELSSALDDLRNSQQALLQSEKLAALGRLVAGVAHELNTPIGNSLLSATTLAEYTESFARAISSGSLKRSLLEDFVAQSREASGILVRNLDKAAEQIRSFKQVAADQASSQRRRFALKEVVDEMLLAHGPMFRRSRVEVRADVPEAVSMDSYPGPLGQVLGNLVTNAALHAYEGTAAGAVELFARLHGEHAIEIAVADRGRGIPESDHKRIFEPFFTTRLGRGGTGLGLAISHRIVTETLGGTISVQSQAGLGATFFVRVPLIAPASAAREPA
jgi:PAS domain S-box-containing protein